MVRYVFCEVEGGLLDAICMNNLFLFKFSLTRTKERSLETSQKVLLRALWIEKYLHLLWVGIVRVNKYK
jgi:hypothetical protein